MIYRAGGATYNIYCDESCHLEHDHQSVMVLGAVWCPLEKTREIAVRIREIKQQYRLPPNFEIKWTKVSPAKQDFYLELLNYFFDDDDLHFRALIVPDKSLLRHQEHRQTHDDWYYKMYFDLLKVILSPDAHYRIYLDIKDTRSAGKVARLHEVLSHERYDFKREIVEIVQTIRSYEAEQMQLVDFLSGIISYTNRGLNTSRAKNQLIERMRHRSGYELTQTTLYKENKVNLFRWRAS